MTPPNAPGAPKKKVGRPTKRSPKLATRICAAIASGKSLRTVAKMPGMGSLDFIMEWRANDETFSEQYARAREDRANALAEEMLDVARNPVMGKRKVTRGRGKSKVVEVQEGDMVERSRLIVDTLKWNAARMLPQRYGEKVQIQGGGPGAPPIALSVDPSPQFAALLTQAKRRRGEA